MKTVIAILLLSMFSIALVNSRSPEKAKMIKLMDDINRERRHVSPGSANMREVMWSDCLASVASNYLRQCNAVGSSNENRNTQAAAAGCESFDMALGETIFHAPMVGNYDPVNIWAMQSRNYNFYENQCAENFVCDDYLQVVNAAVSSVGCAHIYESTCGEDGRTGETYVCYYAPAADNSRPYKEGQSCSDCGDLKGCKHGLCVEEEVTKPTPHTHHTHRTRPSWIPTFPHIVTPPAQPSVPEGNNNNNNNNNNNIDIDNQPKLPHGHKHGHGHEHEGPKHAHGPTGHHGPKHDGPVGQDGPKHGHGHEHEGPKHAQGPAGHHGRKHGHENGDNTHGHHNGEMAHGHMNGENTHVAHNGAHGHGQMHGDNKHGNQHGTHGHGQMHGDDTHGNQHGAHGHGQMHGGDTHGNQHGAHGQGQMHGDNKHGNQHGAHGHGQIHGDDTHGNQHGAHGHGQIHGDDTHENQHGAHGHGPMHGDDTHGSQNGAHGHGPIDGGHGSINDFPNGAGFLDWTYGPGYYFPGYPHGHYIDGTDGHDNWNRGTPSHPKPTPGHKNDEQKHTPSHIGNGRI